MRTTLLLPFLLSITFFSGCGAASVPVVTPVSTTNPCDLVDVAALQALPGFAGLGSPTMDHEQKETYPFVNKCVVSFPDPSNKFGIPKLVQVLVYQSREGFDAATWYENSRKGLIELAKQTDAAYTITIGDLTTKIGAIKQPQGVSIGGNVTDAYFDGFTLHMKTSGAAVDVTAGTLFGTTLGDVAAVARVIATKL